MLNKIRPPLKVEFIVPALIIIFAFTGALGILPVNFEQMVLAILGFLAIDALVERTTFFNNLKGEVNKLSARKGLRSRLEPDYKDFNPTVGARKMFSYAACRWGSRPYNSDFISRIG